MNTYSLRPFLCGFLALLTVFSGSAQTFFVGTNAPGTGTNFTVNLAANVTNLSLTVSNTGAVYSHLLVKRGGVPTDANYDWIAQLNGANNAINLQLPELSAPTNYGLRVRTPAGSALHPFRVAMTTNRADIRSNAYPALKPLVFSTTGVLTNTPGVGTWHYFQVNMPTNLPAGWRVVLSSTGAGNPDLYIRRAATPVTFAYDKISQSRAIDTIIFTDTEATANTYFIGAYLPPGAAGNANYTLSAEIGFQTTLTWDPGATHLGTQILTNLSASGGDYFFRISTLNTANQIWRTALNVFGGEADVYLLHGSRPSQVSYNYRSERVGSDGFCLVQGGQFSPAQDWYLMVYATPNAQWNLVSGEAHVLQLPPLAANASSGTNVPMGAEGMRFFKTTISAGTLAWRLGLNGLPNQVLVKKAAAPHPLACSYYDLAQNGQMLVVPTYLNIGDQYFVGVVGNPGLNVTLDSRQQVVTDLPFNSLTNLTVAGGSFGYVTYRVQVPVQQIAWQLNLAPLAGDASISVRQSAVPNEFVNTAFSETPAPIADSVTLVPPTLTDGTWYLTVLGGAPYSVALTNGQPIITDVNYVFSITNDAPARAGWRFYRVVNTAQQLGTLGWDLFLSNHVAGSEIALRRNAVPSRWNFRNNPTCNSTASSTSSHVDFSGTGGFLQRPGHQADVWYIGVYQPNVALGPFVLKGQELTGPLMAFDSGNGTTNTVSGQPVGKWQYYRVDVPTNNAFGWDLRIQGVTSGDPRLVVRRDALPDVLYSHPNNPCCGWGWNASVTWPSGYQAASTADWTGYSYDPNGTNRYGHIFQAGMGNPLQAGTYYVGVLNSSGPGSGNPMSYQLVSRGIGTNVAIGIRDLAWTNGVVSSNGLPAREAAYYRVQVPSNAPSWKFKLTATAGESLVLLQRTALPNVGAYPGAASPNLTGGRKLQKFGDEIYLLLPDNGQSNIAAGTYYLAVVGEGVSPNPGGSGSIGSGTSSYTITSYGSVALTNLGTLDASGAVDLVHNNANESAEAKPFRFTVPPGTLALEVMLQNRVGNPWMTLRNDAQLPYAYEAYGRDGGQSPLWQDFDLINIANPTPGVYTLMVSAAHFSGGYSNASYTIRVHAVNSTPIAFDGGSIPVVNQTYDHWRYFSVTVPSNAFGWDLRLRNTSSGDPRLVVRRELAPDVLYSHPNNTCCGWGWNSANNWPTGYQAAAAVDWTGFNGPTGTNEYGHLLQMGMGNPLEPGRYLIGVFTGNGNASNLSYTLVSRGIGTNLSIPIGSLSFSNGMVMSNSLPAREVAYYRLDVPSNMPSWKVQLTPTNGEALLMLQRGRLPNVGAYSGYHPVNLNGGKNLQKPGKDHYLMLPDNGQTNIAAGTYYLAVASEGQNPNVANNNRIGTNGTDFTLKSIGTIGITNLGTVDSSGATDLTRNDGMEGTESRIYQFNVPLGTLSLEVRLENRVGNPVMTLRNDGQIPTPAEGFGRDGGQSPSWQHASLINIANPPLGLFTLTVSAAAYLNGYSNATYTVRVHALGTIPVAFDGGAAAITAQAPNVWQYFIVNVPTNSFGWDLRLTNVLSGDPRLSVRRAVLPNALYSHPDNLCCGWNWFAAGNWPTGYQAAAATDWTGFNGTNGANEYGHLLQVGRGNPLEPGLYYVGVFGGGGNTSNLTYTLASRGIGTNLSLPIVSLPFSGGFVTNTGLRAREAAYYCVVVPTNTPSWKLRLAPTIGDAALLVQKDFLPNVGAYSGYSSFYRQGGKKMQKAGNEHYLELPLGTGVSYVPAGTYYIAVVSEGVNSVPANNWIGSGATSFALRSFGSLVTTNLGVAGGADLIRTNTLEGAEIKVYRFSIPPNTAAVEVRLDNRAGNPHMTLRTGDFTPSTTDSFARDGGEAYLWQDADLITLANPVATNYTLSVFAAYNNAAVTYSDAAYAVVVHTLPTPTLNFDAQFNTNGFSNVASNTLADTARSYYRVVVPTNFNGVPVLGWKLDLTQSQGTPSVRVRKNLLPTDDYYELPYTSTYATGEAVIVPEYLTPGTWFVEVKAAGVTTFRLVSSALRLERPAWSMPMIGQSVSTLGLPPSGPLFGDTGVGTNGVALPLDQGVDLEQGDFHYYAVVVPTNNVGVLRTRLDAISGDPNLYIRVGQAPTLTHRFDGLGGTIYERSLTATAGSEYGNWVPQNTRFEFFLTPGTWYLAVQASGNSNVRYRLRTSVGDVQNLALNNGTFLNQTIAAGDWRYYRVVMPTNAPQNWNVTFNQHVGDAVMYFRDTAPPGQYAYYYDYRDWNNDQKNHGPYPNLDAQGSYNFGCPPVRPGAVYYVGFRAVNDATFSVSANTNNGFINYTNVIPFYAGFVTNVIPPNGVLRYRVDVPADAYRWVHTAIHSNPVSLFLDQGSVPTKTTSDHAYWIGQQNTSFNVYLRTPNSWPWQPNYMYFLFVTNNSAIAQPFSFRMDGRNAATDDNDGDGLPDAWEITYYPNIFSYNGASDPDGDGVNNADEFADGTNPVVGTSFKARLTLVYNHGTVTRNPVAVRYTLGTVVTVNAAPDPGYVFLGYTGDASGNANPLNVTMTGHKTINVVFGINPLLPNADYRFQNSLMSSIGTPPNLQDIGAGNNFQSEIVNGFARVIYRFPAGNGLQLRPTTGVIPSNVWSMVIFFRFDAVTGWRRIVDFKSPQTEFGLYNLGGNLHFYPVFGGNTAPILASNYVQVVLTRNETNLVRGYVNGVQQFSFIDSANYAVIGGTNYILRFFKDDSGDIGSGAVSRIRLYDHELTPEQVPLLDQVPGGAIPLVFISPTSYLGGVARMNAQLTPGFPYLIQATTNFVNWIDITNIVSGSTPVQIADPNAAPFRYRFYRGVTP